MGRSKKSSASGARVVGAPSPPTSRTAYPLPQGARGTTAAPATQAAAPSRAKPDKSTGSGGPARPASSPRPGGKPAPKPPRGGEPSLAATLATKPAPAYPAVHPADIKLLVLDVDGVMTDGGIYIAADGAEVKRFDVQDGAGVKYWQRTGRTVAILSGRSAAATLFRAAELGVEHVRQNAKRKLPVYMELLKDLGISPAETAVMGDDLPDLPLMRHCGFAIAPANAVEEVRAAARLVTLKAGGHGAVREAIEHLLRAAGQWETLLQRYREDG